MTIEANTVQYAYVGDDVTVAFPFPSRFLASTDIIVGIDGVQQTGGFTVTGAELDAGGEVTFDVAPAAGTLIMLVRNPPQSQLTNWVNAVTVLAPTLTNALDKLTMVVQWLSRQFGRTVRLGDLDGGALSALPSITNRANRLLAFGSNGDIDLSVPTANVAILQSGIAQLEAQVAALVEGYTYIPTGRTQFFITDPQFGAVSGVPLFDNKGAIDLAIAAASVHGGDVIVPGGEFYTSGLHTLPAKVNLIGLGGGTLIITHATNDFISLTTNNYVTGVYLYAPGGLRTGNAVLGTAGHGIKILTGATECYVQRNKIVGMAHSIFVGTSTLIYITENIIYKAAIANSMGIEVGGDTAGNDTYLDFNFIRSSDMTIQGHSGICLRNTGAVMSRHNGVLWSGYSYIVQPLAGQFVSWVFSTDDILDSGTIGLLLDPRPADGALPAGIVKGCQFLGLWSSSHANYNALLGAAGGVLDGIDIGSFRFLNGGEYGFVALGGTNWMLHDGIAAGNSASSPGDFDAIHVAAGVSGWAIRGVRAGVVAGLITPHRWACYIEDGAGDHYQIALNDFRDNIAALYNGATGTDKVVLGNLPI